MTQQPSHEQPEGCLRILFYRSSKSLFWVHTSVMLTQPATDRQPMVHTSGESGRAGAGVALTRKNCVFYAKKEQATQI